MRRKLIIIAQACLGATFGAVMATVFMGVLSGSEKTPVPMDPTSADARRHQSWICDVAVEPKDVADKEARVPILEAWLEAATEENPFLVWFPYRKRLDYNFLCFRIPLSQEGEYRFTLEGHNQERNVLGTTIDGRTEFIFFAKSQSDGLHPKSVTAQYTKYVHGSPYKAGTITFTPIVPK
jgi:hypothetical protein